LDYTEIQREIVREEERETVGLRGVGVHGGDEAEVDGVAGVVALPIASALLWIGSGLGFSVGCWWRTVNLVLCAAGPYLYL
jgi:hypothetical protein